MKTPFNLLETTVAQVQQAYSDNNLTCVQLVEQYLQRIEQLDKTPPVLNAVIAVNPNVLEDARRLDEQAAAGSPKGPLFGVPVLLKDNCETKDMPTTAGSLSLQGWQTGRDAFLVEKLRQAGALILAKTNLHEFAVWGETVSSVLGQSYNPYDYTRTPGGSSGGTGAALAANMGLVGIGTDTINSIRSPASACSLCGIRPTIGLVSRSGVVPYSLTQDTAGPLARTVEDAVRVLDVIAGCDPSDPVTAAADEHRPRSYLDYLKKDGLKGKRLGILSSFFSREEADRPVNQVMARALRLAAEAGAEFVLVEDVVDSAALVRDVSVHLHDLKTHLGAYLESFKEKVPVHSLDEILASGKYTPDIEENLRQANALGVTAPDYEKRLELRAQLQKWLVNLLDEKQVDALVYPHQQQLVCKAGASQAKRNGVLGSVTGFPAMVVPAGFSPASQQAPIGVPVGMELIGRPFDEGRLIEIAYGFEQAAHQRLAPFTPDNPNRDALERQFEQLI